MTQTGHNPHGYNSVTYHCHNLGAISLAKSVNTDTSNQLINVSNRTQSTRLQFRFFQRHNLGEISLAVNVNMDTRNQVINVSNRT